MKKTYKITAIAFDMDGVIIDSNAAIEKFWQQWAAKENLVFTNETAIRYIHGRATLETINELFEKSTQEIKNQILEAAIDFEPRPALPL